MLAGLLACSGKPLPTRSFLSECRSLFEFFSCMKLQAEFFSPAAYGSSGHQAGRYRRGPVVREHPDGFFVSGSTIHTLNGLYRCVECAVNARHSCLDGLTQLGSPVCHPTVGVSHSVVVWWGDQLILMVPL